MDDKEYFDCAYNYWEGFVGKETCEAGFLYCDEEKCPMYCPIKKEKAND